MKISQKSMSLKLKYLACPRRTESCGKKGSSAEFVGKSKGVAHPAPNLLRDMWTNTDPEHRGRQDAGQEYSQPGGEVQGFCVRAGALARRRARAGAGGGGAAACA